jgi:phosphatidylserine decarboxylase
LHGRRNPFVAQEGLPWIIAAVAAVLILIRYFDPLLAVIPGLLIVLFFMVFRDPLRELPSVALGVFSPVDGKVLEVGRVDRGDCGAPALRILIKVDSLGTYTARAPVEGTIRDLGKKGLMIQTDEGHDVVLKFSGYRFGLPPKSFARIGERLGQGQRCAFLRLTRLAEVQFPEGGKILVEAGQTVVAGEDVIGSLSKP